MERNQPAVGWPVFGGERLEKIRLLSKNQAVCQWTGQMIGTLRTDTYQSALLMPFTRLANSAIDGSVGGGLDPVAGRFPAFAKTESSVLQGPGGQKSWLPCRASTGPRFWIISKPQHEGQVFLIDRRAIVCRTTRRIWSRASF